MNGKIKSYKDLMIWQRSIALVTEVYKLTQGFPAEEKYGIVQQIKRSAVSIPSNIAEGAAQNNTKEFRQFLGIALGSMAELDTQLIISDKLSFIQDTELYNEIVKELGELRAMTIALVNKL
jgi:four helix bundle protein